MRSIIDTTTTVDEALKQAWLNEPVISKWKRPLEEWEVRIKVGNFAGIVDLIMNIGDYNARDENGAPTRLLKAGPIGWSAHLFSRKRLEKLGAFNISVSSSPEWFSDVKFAIRRSMIPRILEIFSVTKSKSFEYELYREFQEELANEVFPGRRETPILTESDVSGIKAKYRWVVVYETRREDDDGKNMSISRVFDVSIPSKILKKLRKADSIIFTPTAKELRVWEMKRDGEVILISRKAQFFDRYKKGRIAGYQSSMVRAK